MNLLVVLAFTLFLFYLGGWFYATGIGRKIGLNDAEPTPAVRVNDGKDYVPTKFHILFGHHFATIAGAGPIIGPTVAILYGFAPAWLWILIGGIFFGAVHDFTSLFVSVKEGGKSLAEITRKTIGKSGFYLFIGFTLMMLFLVCASFLNATAISLTSFWSLEKLGLSEDQTVLRAVTNPSTGIKEGAIGGIASTSVICITFLAPLLGWLIYRKKTKVLYVYVIAAVIAFGSVFVGFHYPVTLQPKVWMIILSIYCFIAAGLPVWVILQPRDFTNVQILYGGIVLLIVSVIIGGISGAKIDFPMTNLAQGSVKLGMIWPMLFITIACGAISGFHALVAGGTTSKQLLKQSYSRKIGYSAMLLESTLALLVILAIAGNLKFTDYMHIVWPEPGQGTSNPILAFSLSVGHTLNNVMGLPIYIGTIFGILMVEGFVITSLDSAVRFIRYIFEEFWNAIWPTAPKIIRVPWFNSGLAVLGMWGLAASNSFSALWPIFGSANQLLAALTLITITIWLTIRGLKNWFTIIPAIFMSLTTICSLILLLFTKYLKTQNYILICADIILLILAGWLGVISIIRIKKKITA